MMHPQHISNAAKTQLLESLQKQNCKVLTEKTEQNGTRFTIVTAKGREHEILLRLLNLDKDRSLKIPKSDFNYELRDNLWVLLVLYMYDMEPFSYLIPSLVFATPNQIFIDNEQLPRFRHFSNWEIKVFRKGIEELSKYALETMIKDLR